MIYEIIAGGIRFYTADTDLLDVNTGVYHGNTNLYVRTDYDRGSNETNNYIYPVSRTVYYRADGSTGNYQYLTITSVTALSNVYYNANLGGDGGYGLFTLLFMGVIAVCSVFRIFTRG